jgi:hypothetical protein
VLDSRSLPCLFTGAGTTLPTSLVAVCVLLVVVMSLGTLRLSRLGVLALDDGLSDVLGQRAVAQVRQPVVGGVADAVKYLLSLGNWTDKRQHDEVVDAGSLPLALAISVQAYTPVSPFVGPVRKLLPRNEHGGFRTPSARVMHCAVNRSDPSRIADLVLRPLWNRSPLLHAGSIAYVR